VRPRRVLVYGVTGSGKSTIAARISDATRIPWTHVDDLTWEPGWVAVPEADQRRRFTQICAGESWILDTAYSDWLDVALARADLVVGLDYPRWLSLGRLLRRTVARIIDRTPICNGNVETLRGALSRDSIIAWHFRTFRSRRQRLDAWAADPDGPRLVRLRSHRETEAWLATLQAEAEGTGSLRE
jgi:adenylate kinase family enzyme